MEASWLWFFFGGPYFDPQLASWSALGRLRAPKNIVRIGSWTAQGHRGDLFQRSWGPKGSQNWGPRGSKIEQFLASISGSIVGAFWAPQNHEKSYWRLGEKRIFTKSPISFWGPFSYRFWSQKWVQNGIRIVSSTRTPSGSLLETSWNPLGGSWGRKKVVQIALGPSWDALGGQKPPKKNLAIMEREAGEAENAKHCKRSKSCNQGKRSKTIRSTAT